MVSRFQSKTMLTYERVDSRQQIILRFVENEKKFLELLQDIHRLYLEPLKHRPDCLSQEDYHSMFDIVHDLLSFHTSHTVNIKQFGNNGNALEGFGLAVFNLAYGCELHRTFALRFPKLKADFSRLRYRKGFQEFLIVSKA
jgi:hypothetical protein